MAWSATEQANSSATAFDVRLRMYAGPFYSSLDLSIYTIGSIPSDWTSADLPASGWTEITSRVSQNGRFTHERSGSAIRWTADLNGWDYDASYLGIGRAIVVLRTLEVAGVTTGPGLWFVGQVCAGSSQDDVRHGGQWTRSVRGTDSLIERANAPRLTAGIVNIADGASATASSTLATPEVEAGSGEFLGSTTVVDAANAVDNNLNTVWISADTPSVTGETPVTGAVVIDKLFAKPLVGYDQTKLWWIEIYNGTASDVQMNGVYPTGTIVPWGLVDQAGGVLTWPKTYTEVLKTGERGIVCSSRADFETYTGGARNAAWVIEAKTWPLDPGTARLAINPTAGSLTLRQWTVGATWLVVDAVAWNATGAAPSPAVSGWSGAALNSGSLADGSVWRRSPSGTDTGTAADWIADDAAEPGDFAEPGQVEWLLITPAGQDAALAADCLAGASTISLTSTSGLSDAGSGVCEADAFTWTGRTAATLTGVSGIGAHSQGARVYQTDGGVSQTGWPVRRVEVRRRPGLSVPSRARLYIQKTGESAPRTPPSAQTYDEGTSSWYWDEDWKADWDSNVLSYGAGSNSSVAMDDSGTLVWTLNDASATGYRWVRRVLVYIEQMSDSGRAKVNDVRILLAESDVSTPSFSGPVDAGTSLRLARHLLVTEYGLAAGAFVDGTYAGYGSLGSHSTAIAPYTTVLEDLARVTGCCVGYRPDGKVEWLMDPWWPLGSSDLFLTPYATLDDSYVRGTARCGDELTAETAVTVRARTMDGEQQFEATYPLNTDTDALKREFTDYVVPDVASCRALAEALYCRNGLFLAEKDAGPATVSPTLTGIGEWLTPDLWVRLYMLLADQQVSHTGVTGVETPGYLVERVGFEWQLNEQKQRTWKAAIDMRRFRR